MIYFFDASGSCICATTNTHPDPAIAADLLAFHMANMNAANHIEDAAEYDFQKIYFADGAIHEYTPAELTAKNTLRPGFVWKMPERIAHDTRTLPQARTEKLMAVSAACDAALAPVKAGYPLSEQQSWDKQETEARAWTADNTKATPLLSALAQARGLALADLAGRVIQKADAFAQMTGAIVGKRQRLEDQILSAATIAEIDALNW